MLDRDAILKADDAKYDEVETPEWGGDGKVRVRSMNGHELDRFLEEKKGFEEGGSTSEMKTMALAVALCTVGPDGKQLFTENDVGDLLEKNTEVMLRVFQRICNLSAIEMDALEEAEKN